MSLAVVCSKCGREYELTRREIILGTWLKQPCPECRAKERE